MLSIDPILIYFMTNTEKSAGFKYLDTVSYRILDIMMILFSGNTNFFFIYESKIKRHSHLIFYFQTQACDGAGLSFLFGKRNIEARDVHARCCFTDLCNIPPRIPSITSGSSKTTAQSTTTTIQPTITTFSVHPGI